MRTFSALAPTDILRPPHRRARRVTDGARSARTENRLTADDDKIEESATDRERALARLHKKRDFQGHVVAYVVVNAALWAIWG